MSSEAGQFTLEELQEIKDQIEQYGVDLTQFKSGELSTLEICKDVGCFNGETWLSGYVQAGWSFWNNFGLGKALHYVAGMLQWEKVFGRETFYVGQYYLLNNIFVAADTPQGSFDSGMATLLDKSSEGEADMYLVCLYSGETLQWPFKVIGLRAIPLPLAYHNDTPSYEDGWWEYHSKCFHVLLQMPEGDQVILPSGNIQFSQGCLQNKLGVWEMLPVV